MEICTQKTDPALITLCNAQLSKKIRPPSSKVARFQCGITIAKVFFCYFEGIDKTFNKVDHDLHNLNNALKIS